MIRGITCLWFLTTPFECEAAECAARVTRVIVSPITKINSMPTSVMATKCLCLFLLHTILLGGCLGCSCMPDSLSRSRGTAICDDFSESENVFIASVQEVYCKCFPQENDDTQFSCIKYEREGGLTSGETQESFSCNNSVAYSFSYLICDQVSDELRVGKLFQMSLLL